MSHMDFLSFPCKYVLLQAPRLRIFEVCQQSVANLQSPKSRESLHKTANGISSDLFSATIKKNGKKRSGHTRLYNGIGACKAVTN